MNRRDDLASILEVIAKDGLSGPRDLDVAIDAIDCIYGSYCSVTDIVQLITRNSAETNRTIPEVLNAVKRGILALCSIAEDRVAEVVKAARVPAPPCDCQQHNEAPGIGDS